MDRGEPLHEPSEILPDGSRVVDGEVLPSDEFEGEVDTVNPDEYEPDETLFDDEETEKHFIHDAAAVAVRAMDHLPDKTYPQSVHDVIAARRAKKARAARLSEREDAYSELGGGVSRRDEWEEIPRDEILKNVLEEYEDWQIDIKEAVERFGVIEFSRKQLTSMDDFETYSLHFYNYMELIQASMRQIKSVEGVIEQDEYLRSRYPGRSVEEMQAYYATLEWLMYELIKTGIPRATCVALEPKYGKLEWSDGNLDKSSVRSNRLKAIKGMSLYKKSHKKYPHVQVVGIGGKPHLDHMI